MKTSRRFSLLLAMLATLAVLPAAAAGPDESQARAVISDRFDAALRADTVRLEKLLADDLDYCNFRGECETKRQYIGEIRSGQLKYKAIEHTIERVKLFADSAAITGKVTATATRNGVERTIHASYLAVVVFRDQRFQLTSWSTTLLELTENK